MLAYSSQGLNQEIGSLVELVRPSLVGVGERSGFGSGVVWADDLVVTNDHVAQTDRPLVRLFDGRQVQGRVVARDNRNDLAAVRIEGVGAKPIATRAEEMRVGELVIALGHPLGRLDVPTLGMVSGVGPSSWMGRTTRDLIQVDVSLAPGNSGGPILDADARMIGMACMIASPGMALVIPTRTVQRFVETIRRRARNAA